MLASIDVGLVVRVGEPVSYLRVRAWLVRAELRLGDHAAVEKLLRLLDLRGGTTTARAPGKPEVDDGADCPLEVVVASPLEEDLDARHRSSASTSCDVSGVIAAAELRPRRGRCAAGTSWRRPLVVRLVLVPRVDPRGARDAASRASWRRVAEKVTQGRCGG